MIRVIQLITSLEMGGAERVAINISKSSDKKFEYHIIEIVRSDSSFSDSLKKELQRDNVHYYSSPFKKKKIAIILFSFWFFKLYLKIKPNIIHSHTEIPDLSLWLFRKISWIFFSIKPQYVRTIHNTKLWVQWQWIGDKVEYFFKRMHANIAISESTRTCYLRNYGEAPPIILNGLQSVEQKPFAQIKKGKINILFAGRFEYQKGIDQLIEVVTTLKDNQRFHFHIVGNGSMGDKVYAALEKLPNVSLYEKIFGLNRYIGSFDYLFMPSNHEGLALMPIEASLAHTPTIINNCPGLKDTLPNDWPLKVEDNYVEDFIRLFLLLDGTSNYDEYANAAYDFAEKHFSIKKMQHEYEKLYIKKYNK